MTRRARAVALLGASAACAGLAASLVNGYASEVRSQVGPLRSVVAARTDIPRDRRVTPGNMGSLMEIRRVPTRFAPPDALGSPVDAVGLRAAVAIERGGYVERGDLEVPSAGGGSPTSGAPTARIVEVPVAGAGVLADLLRAGARVDVLVTSDGAGGGRTYLALQRIELVALRTGADTGGGGEGSAADGVATLRVSLRQAVLLTAASNFAREVRLVPRPARDERLLKPTAVSAGELRP